MREGSRTENGVIIWQAEEINYSEKSDAIERLTGAGATYPYGKDPRDTNIRLAPSYPPLDELEQAMRLFCLCVKMAGVKKLLAE